MKKLAFLTLLLPCFLFSQAFNPSRRLNSPQQFAFGPWTSVYPFNKNSGFNDVYNDALQPSALITDTETFGSTSDFTAVGAGCSSQTFTVSGNVGTISASAASTCVYLVNGTSWPAPDAMVPLAINQVGAALSSDTLGVGMCKSDGSVQILSQYDQVNGNAQIDVFTASTSTLFGTITFSTPVGSSIALGLESGSAVVWYGSAAGGWSMATKGTISGTYNPNTDGNLTGFQSCFVVSTGAATTTSWQVSNLISGAGGSPVVGDGSSSGIFGSVNWIDGRPYTNGSQYCITVAQVDGGNTAENATLICYDASTGKAAIQAKYWVDISGALNWMGAPVITYDPSASQYRWVTGAWGLASPPNTYYGVVSKGTIDMLGAAVHVIPSADLTQMTTLSAATGWDPFLLCLNYKPGVTCPKWYLWRTSSTTNNAVLATSTSDPSLNSWTNTDFANLPGNIHEGAQVWRTRAASGTSGVTYNPLFSNDSGTTVQSSIFSLTGTPSYVAVAPLIPATEGVNDPSHLPNYEYGDNVYAFSWNNNVFGASGGPIGQLALAAAPQSVAAPQMTQVSYVANSGSTAVTSITTSATTISAGCYLVFGTGFNSSGLSGITISSAPSATWTQLSYYNGGNANNGLVIAMATLPSGSTTFTSTPSASAQYQDMVVMQLTGTTCVADSTAQTNGTSVGNQNVSGISSAHSDLAVICSWSGSTSTAIGPYTLTGSQSPWLAYNNTTTASNVYANCGAGVIPAGATGYAFTGDTFPSTANSSSSVVGIEFSTASPPLPIPTFSAVTGATYATQTVTISDSAATAICYTTDGSIPIITNGSCQHGSIYSAPVSVDYGSSVMAVAWKLGFSPTMPTQYAYDSSKLIRGITTGTFTSSTVTVTFPSGSQTGDTCVLVFGSGYNISSPPAGWTLVQGGSSFYYGAFLYKNLTSGDISAGSVSVSMAGSYNGVWTSLDLYGSHTYNTGNNSGYASSLTPPTALSMPAISSGLAGNLLIITSETRSSAAGSLNRATFQSSVSDGSRASSTINAMVLPTGYSAPVIYKAAGNFNDSCCRNMYTGWIVFSN